VDELLLIYELLESVGQYIIASFNSDGIDNVFLSTLGIAKIVVNGVPFRDARMPAVSQLTRQRLEKNDTH
jgi:hypothetical protein